MNLERSTAIDPGLFAPASDPKVQRNLFRSYVHNITLELFDYCMPIPTASGQ